MHFSTPPIPRSSTLCHTQHKAFHPSYYTGRWRAKRPIPSAIANIVDTVINCVTLSSTAASGTISRVSGSHLPDDIEEFMKDIGKGGTAERELVRDIYLFTGRALWESSITGRIGLSSGSAKALVGLMLNIT